MQRLDHLVWFRSIQGDTQSSSEAKGIRGTGVNSLLSHGSNALFASNVALLLRQLSETNPRVWKYLGFRVYWTLGLALSSHCAPRYERSSLKVLLRVHSSSHSCKMCTHVYKTHSTASVEFNWSVVWLIECNKILEIFFWGGAIYLLRKTNQKLSMFTSAVQYVSVTYDQYIKITMDIGDSSIIFASTNLRLTWS